MAKREANKKVEKHDFASELGKQSLDLANAANTQASSDALKAIAESFEDQDNEYVYYDAAEDADDEFDIDDDYEEIQPLTIKKTKTDEDSDQVCLSTTNPEQTTQSTTQVHGRVEWTKNLAQAQKNSAEAGHSAPLALEHNLPRTPRPYPDPLALHKASDLLHPSPPLRRRKGSMALRKETSDSDITRGMMYETGQDHRALYSNAQDNIAEDSNNSDEYSTPTHHGKMLKAGNIRNMLSGHDKGNAEEIGQRGENSTSSENGVSIRKTSDFGKADAVWDYGEGLKITPENNVTNQVLSPKPSDEKKSLRRMFHRKGSKKCTTPPSSSGETAGRMKISAPTLVDASPDAKILLNSACSLVDASADIKNVVNYSRPITSHSPSDVSSGSPVKRGRSSSALHDSIPFPGVTTSREGPTDKSGNIAVGLKHSSICDHPKASGVRGKQAFNQHGAIAKTSAAEKNQDASDSDSFNPSDYSGDENSVQQAVAVPIVFSGRAKLVDVRPPRGTDTAASGHRSGVGSATTRGIAQLTDHVAEALGAQDADRYYADSMISQTRPTAVTTDDPFIDPAYRKLLAKPANEIAAKEMARIKAAREAGNMAGGLMERTNALLAKGDAKPGVETSEDTTAGPRNTTGESLLSKMRALRKKPRKGKEQEDSEEEVLRKVQAGKERGFRQEVEINAMIKANLAEKDAANGGVRGAGIPRIDYGPPNLRTTLGGCGPTDEERTHARTLESRRAAGWAAVRMQNKEDKTTARGHFEGY